MVLWQKFLRLKTSIGGNREKHQFEHTFGLPREEQFYITTPNKWHRRIVSELEFAIRMSIQLEGKYNDQLESCIDMLLQKIDVESTFGKTDVLKAEDMLKELYNDSKEYKLILAAHAHIDMNWMWSWQETVAATLSTFRTMLTIMDKYPEFCYSQSQASVYKIVEDYDPQLMDRIKKYIESGRWEVTASAWVESDKNMPSTESLARHILYTKKYMKEVWGVPEESLELDFAPDTFGHANNIPEINTAGDVKYYYHCRGYAGEETLYQWQGTSGNKVMVYREPYWYNSGITPHIGIGIVDLAKKCKGLKTGLIVYGVGNHGGGPTRRDLEYAIEMQEWPVFPQIKFGTIREYFKEAESVRDKLEVVKGELNFIFPGCYTTQSRIKREHRKSEAALYNAEAFNAFSNSLTGSEYPHKRFEKAWQNVLFTQFHDILTGSNVQDSREHAMGLFSDSLAIANTQISNSMITISEQIDTSSIMSDDCICSSQSEGAGAGYGISQSCPPSPERGAGLTRIYHVFNPSSISRKDTVEITVWDWLGDMRRIEFTDSKGSAIKYQLQDKELCNYWDHKYFRILLEVEVPAMGYSTYVMNESKLDSYSFYYNADDRIHNPYQDYVLENNFIKAVVDSKTASITSIVDKKTNNELLADGQCASLCFVEEDSHNADAWRIGRYMSITPILDSVKIKPLAIGDDVLVQKLEFEMPIKSSTIKGVLSLDKNSPTLDFSFEVDWHEYSTPESTIPMLCYKVPAGYQVDKYMYNTPAGTSYRDNMKIDVPALSYGVAINKEGKSLGLTTDCKYGFRGDENSIAVTLIHSACYPDPYPERGIHKINLSLLVTDDDPKKAYELSFIKNNKLFYSSSRPSEGTLPMEMSLLKLSNDTSAIISSVKYAEDGNGIIVRLSNQSANDTVAKVTVYKEVKDAKCIDIMENTLDYEVSFNNNTVEVPMTPYSIRSLRIEL